MHPWMVNAIKNMFDVSKSRGVIPKNTPATCAVFFEYDCMRFYYACRVALVKPGNPTENFLRLDPVEPEFHFIFHGDRLRGVVDWMDAHRVECKACDNRATAMGKTLAGDWTYFDGLPDNVVAAVVRVNSDRTATLRLRDPRLSLCKICDRQLRNSGLGTGQTQVQIFDLSSGMSGDIKEYLEELNVPARYVCPDCASTYCCDCLKDLLCPDCRSRVRLG